MGPSGSYSAMCRADWLEAIRLGQCSLFCAKRRPGVWEHRCYDPRSRELVLSRSWDGPVLASVGVTRPAGCSEGDPLYHPRVPSPRSGRLWGPGPLHPGRDESPGPLCHPWACIQNLPQPQPTATPSSSHRHRRSFWRVTASPQGADWLLRSREPPTLVEGTRGPSLTAQPWSRGPRTARHSQYHLLVPVPRQKGRCSVPCFPPMSGRGFPERRPVGQSAARASQGRAGCSEQPEGQSAPVSQNAGGRVGPSQPGAGSRLRSQPGRW